MHLSQTIACLKSVRCCFKERLEEKFAIIYEVLCILCGVYVTTDYTTRKTLTCAVECDACMRCHVEFHRDQHHERSNINFYTVRRRFNNKLRFVFTFSLSDIIACFFLHTISLNTGRAHRFL